MKVVSKIEPKSPKEPQSKRIKVPVKWGKRFRVNMRMKKAGAILSREVLFTSSKESIKDKMDLLSDIQIDGIDSVLSYTTDERTRKFVESFREKNYDEINTAIQQLGAKL